MKKISQMELISALLLVLMFPGLIYLSFYFSDKAYSVEGPSIVHSGPGNTFAVLIDNMIVRVNGDGDLLSSLDMASSGIDRKVVDFNVRRDGSMLLGLAGEPRIVSYSSQGRLLKEYEAAPSAPPRDFPEYFRIAESPDGTLYLSDAYSDSVLAYSPSGQLVFSSFSPKGGKGPGRDMEKNPVKMLSEAMFDEKTNRTRMKPEKPYDWVNGIVYSEGLVYVADTNNHRVVLLNADGSYNRILPVTGKMPEPFEHPSDIFVAGHDLYVLNVHPVGPGGNIARIDIDTGRISRFDLRFATEHEDFKGLFFHPTGVAASDSSVILTDRDNMAVYRFSRDGDYEGLFHQGEFGELLGSVRLKVRNYTYARYASIAAMCALLVAMLVVSRKQRKKAGSKVDTVSRSGENDHDWNITSGSAESGAGRSKPKEVRTIAWLEALLPFWGQFADGRRWGAFLLFVPFALCFVIYIAFRAGGKNWPVFIPDLMALSYAGGAAILFWSLSAIGLKKIREERHGEFSGLGLSLRAFLFALIPAFSGLLGQLFYEIMSKDAIDLLFSVRSVVHNVFSFILPSDQMAKWAVMSTVHFMFGYGGLVVGLIMLLSINKFEKGDRFFLPGLLGFVIGMPLVSLALVYSNSIPGSVYTQPPLVGLAVGISVAVYSYVLLKKVSLLVIPGAVAGAWAGSFIDMNIFYSRFFDLVFDRIFPDFLIESGLFPRGKAVFVTSYFISLAVFMALGVRAHDDEIID